MRGAYLFKKGYVTSLEQMSRVALAEALAEAILSHYTWDNYYLKQMSQDGCYSFFNNLILLPWSLDGDIQNATEEIFYTFTANTEHRISILVSHLFSLISNLFFLQGQGSIDIMFCYRLLIV